MGRKPETLKDNILVTLSLFALVGFVYVEISQERPTQIRYNCDIAEISPDIPIKVKEECRKMKGQRI